MDGTRQRVTLKIFLLMVCCNISSLHFSPLHLHFLSFFPPPPPPPPAYIVHCEVHSVYKRTTDKRYAYMIQVEWSDGVSYTVRRTYGDFFSFQTKVGVAKIGMVNFIYYVAN